MFFQYVDRHLQEFLNETNIIISFGKYHTSGRFCHFSFTRIDVSVIGHTDLDFSVIKPPNNAIGHSNHVIATGYCACELTVKVKNALLDNKVASS